MNEHSQIIQELLEKESLTPQEVVDGVVACFFATNHAFVERRLGHSTNVDDALSQLITQVFKENEVDPAKPNLHFLKQAVQTLDEQAGFESDPELLHHHQDVIGMMFDRIKK